MTATVQPIMQ